MSFSRDKFEISHPKIQILVRKDNLICITQGVTTFHLIIFIFNSSTGIEREIALNHDLDLPLDSDCFCSAFFFFLF